jgi:hypothetical protein
LILANIASVGCFTDDETILIDSFWTLCYLADCSEESIDFILSRPDLLSQVIQHLTNKDTHIYVPAMRTVGNLCTSNDHERLTIMVELNLLD